MKIIYKPTENSILDDIKSLIEYTGEIKVYPNNEDVNKYNSYKNITDYIFRVITNSSLLCKGLNSSYISDVFDTADAVVIIGSSMSLLPNGNIYGFALINFDEATNSIYIDVICSHIGIKYAGEILIKLYKTFAKNFL